MATSDIKNVTIIGAGILGAQIAVQTACFDFKVTVYDSAEGAFERSVGQFEAIMSTRKKGPMVPIQKWNDGISKVNTVSHMPQALQDADLVIEAVPENLELKRKVFQEMDELAPLPGPFWPPTAPPSPYPGSRMPPEGQKNA
ncbi:MAG: hypothetical protein GY846_26570 [Deltaproteobacteria bacterium]|nr:hypothetical protein [Deltaproteobacteria bacterium]